VKAKIEIRGVRGVELLEKRARRRSS